MGEKAAIAIMNEADEVIRYEPFEIRNALGNQWVATFQSGMGYMARLKLNGEAWSVYAYLVEVLQYDNWVRVRQCDIASTLGMAQPNVARALKKLIDVDVIVQGPMAGRYKTYRMNPRIAHRGSRHYKNNVVQYEELKKRREMRMNGLASRHYNGKVNA